MVDDAINFEQVLIADDGPTLSFRLPPGESVACTGITYQTGDRVIRFCLGMSLPAAGAVRVFGVVPATLHDKELTMLRRRVAVVPPSGGLISNLSAWENLILPVAYHSDLSATEINEQGSAALASVAFRDDLSALPAHLEPGSRCQIGIARAILAGADILIGHSLFDGISDRDSTLLAAGVGRFLDGKDGRSFLGLSSHADSLRHLKLAKIINLQNGSGHEQ